MYPVQILQGCGPSESFYFSSQLIRFSPHSGLQSRESLERLLEGVMKARDGLNPSILTSRKPKLVLKIAPDLEASQLVEMAEVIRKSNIDGVIVSNTTIQRPKDLVSRKWRPS